MTKISVDSKEAFQIGLRRRLKASGDDSIRHFAWYFFADLSIGDLNKRQWQDVTKSVQSSWKFYKGFKGEKPQIRIVPGTDNYLVIEVASTNLPFLLDSIRMELNRLGLVLSDVQQCLMGVIRKGRKLLISEDVELNESLIRLEIESAGAPKDLSVSIARVIELVSQVVEDFASMRKQLLLWSDDFEFSINRRSAVNVSSDPGYELLRWFHANNFTFLGYEEFKPGKRASLQIVPKSRMGLARPGMSSDGLPISVPAAAISLEKLPVRSRVHRPAYLDSITICDRQAGKVTGVCRFMGLFTASVYNQHPSEIPVVKQKIAAIFTKSDVVASSHRGRELTRIIEILPREELFFSTGEDLHRLVTHVYALQERRIVRLYIRQDNYFANCIVYSPRDTYNTALRIQMNEILVSAFQAEDSEFSTYFSESALIRTHFILRISSPVEADIDAIEQQITELTRSWTDKLQELILEKKDHHDAHRLLQSYRSMFSASYRADFSVESAFRDLGFIEMLSAENPLSLNLRETQVKGKTEIHFKLFSLGEVLPLSDVVPILENLGAKTIEEHTYELELANQGLCIHDFLLVMATLPANGLATIKTIFEVAFKEIWRGGKENDSFNRLIPTATMNHRQIALIRAYSRYLGQIQNSSSQPFIADCVTRYSHIARQLFVLFERRFDPSQSCSEESINGLQREILNQIANDVVNLADDRVLRGFVEMMLATQRTNYYQVTESGNPKDYISFKFLPADISEMPEPRPRFEIFVYSPRIEGVHLRGGKIARGGLRWSDRTEDYRTEVLGLVKAQQVKNSVIVPVGAKGGFLPKLIPEHATRDEVFAEGIKCYRIFIQGLLDLTDNLVKGKVVRPMDVICYDEPDYYLVVAADKGTATFSDIANEISKANGFWLADAFASGGSVGFDHKAMGITAKGAWKSVQQHFRDMGRNIQETDFSVIGIGDMSGDVFGNGMLLSKHICLVAAFNHMHIFVDPDPDPKRSFAERQRLFDLPRSSWSDYNQKLISRGGGIFSRLAKSIKVSTEMKKRFKINEASLTPNQLISIILKSEADLLWSGGIGTYVKSRLESHLDVADKANDGIRVDAEQLQCKTVGEGGNLGMTQLARVEFCLNGGSCFTDFIDNAGGVNCSDVEVNIKILLNQLLEKGELTNRSRNSLLRRWIGDVSLLVLENNYRQAQTINLMDFQSARRDTEYYELLRGLEDRGRLDRKLEFLPSEDEIHDRRARGQNLTAPEIAVLTSYVKSILKEELATSDMVDIEHFKDEMFGAFPPGLIRKYSKEVSSHRLARELVATQIANDMVNFMGMNFVARMQESTGDSTEAIAVAYIVARDVFDLKGRWIEICQLDYKIDHRIQKEMMMDFIRLIRRVTRWLLRNRRHATDLHTEIPVFQKVLQSCLANWESLLAGDELLNWRDKRDHFRSAGVPRKLSGFVAAAHHLYSVMGIVEATARTEQDAGRIAQIYFSLGESLQLNWFSRQIHEYEAGSHWQALARETLQDDLHWQQAALTLGVVGESSQSKSVAVDIQNWIQRHQIQVDRWMTLQSEIKSSNNLDPAVFTVAIRELLDLAQSSIEAKRKF